MFKKKRVGKIMLGLFIKTRWHETERQNEEKKKKHFTVHSESNGKVERKRTMERKNKINRKTHPRIKATATKTTMRFGSFFSSLILSLSFVFFLFKNSTECFELPFLYVIRSLSLCVSLLFTLTVMFRVSSILALSSFTISVCLLCVRR